MTVDRLEKAVTDETPKQNYQDGFHPAVTLWRSPALTRYRHGAVRISYIHPPQLHPFPMNDRLPVPEVMPDQSSACWTAVT